MNEHAADWIGYAISVVSAVAYLVQEWRERRKNARSRKPQAARNDPGMVTAESEPRKARSLYLLEVKVWSPRLRWQWMPVRAVDWVGDFVWAWLCLELRIRRFKVFEKIHPRAQTLQEEAELR